jgi:hypothetical protein
MSIRSLMIAAACGFLVAGCSKGPAEGTTPPAGADAPVTDEGPGLPPSGGDASRPTLSAADCEAQGGQSVGDIGDGAIHRADYRCEGGEAPLGDIVAGEGEPVAVEGAVCCPGA